MDKYLSTLLFLHSRPFLGKDFYVVKIFWEEKRERTKEILSKWKSRNSLSSLASVVPKNQKWLYCKISLYLLYLHQATAKWQQSDKKILILCRQQLLSFLQYVLPCCLLTQAILIPSCTESLRQSIIKSLFRIPFDQMFLRFLKIPLSYLIVGTKKELNKIMKFWSEHIRIMCCPNL